MNLAALIAQLNYNQKSIFQLKKLFIFFNILIISISPNSWTYSSNTIQSDFYDLQKNFPILKKHNLLFLDPVPNENYYKRNGKKICMIIVHHTEEPTLTDIKDTIKSLKLSSHFFIDRDGSITITVPLEKKAAHAGISYAKVLVKEKIEELKALNAYSIAIEIVNSGLEPFSEEQMNSVKDLILYLMKRFTIRKDMIFSHAEIGTVIYDSKLEDYTMRKPDPHKLFDWELLEKNGIGLHISDRITTESAKQKFSKVLYKIGDKSDNILKLKKRLNNFFYKILPWSEKNGNYITFNDQGKYTNDLDQNFVWVINQLLMHYLSKELKNFLNIVLFGNNNIIFPDDQSKYTNEFDQSFSWIVSQFSMHHLPREIRKELILTLTKEDILPKFLIKYAKQISNQFTTLRNKIEPYLKQFLSEKDHNHLSHLLTQYNNNISPDTFYTLMYKIELYHNSHVRHIISKTYYKFKDNALSKLDVLIKDITSMKSISSEKAQIASELIEQFQYNVSLEFENFEKQWFQAFQNEWQQKFIPNMIRQMLWTELHEEILQYLEKEKNKLMMPNQETVYIK